MSGHPNALTYPWTLLEGGQGVQLGQFPAARVTRLQDWHWAVANPNVVLVSIETVVAPAAADPLLAVGADVADPSQWTAADTTVQQYPELFRPVDMHGCTRVCIGGHYVTVPVAMLAALRAMDGVDGPDPDAGPGAPAHHTNDVYP